VPASPFTIVKINTAERIVFGYANVSIAKGGKLITDLQDDQITPTELEKGAYEYVLTAREADEMHEGGVVGHLVESIVFTPEKLQVMATDPATGVVDQEGLAVLKRILPPRWWVGFKLDQSAFAKVQSGEYTMFSIAGEAESDAA
jgi:hypothetical protein